MVFFFRQNLNSFVSNFGFRFFPLFFVPSLILFLDIGLRWKILSHMETLQVYYYLLSFLYSILIYFLLLFSLSLLDSISNKKVYWVLLIFSSLSYSVCMIGSYGYFIYTGIMPNFFVFSYIFQEPFNSWTLLSAGLTVWVWIFFFFLLILVFVSLRIASQNFKPVRFAKSIYFSLVFGILILAAFFHNNTRFNDQIYVSDVNSISFINRNLYNLITGDRLGSAGLQSRNRPNLKRDRFLFEKTF
ncbi:hypothetical protein LEP1GSC012_0473 [Leptospira interrogans serovar Valbuzzi str. Valbuzzi]|nr:hypothetical protein LEP1GSC012_0473 [Leptospira interrogans serovar Valbuzzi str. Valbuzzi]